MARLTLRIRETSVFSTEQCCHWRRSKECFDCVAVVGILIPVGANFRVEVTALIDRCVIPENARSDGHRVIDFIERLQFVRAVTRFVVYVELTVMIQAGCIVIVRCSVILQLVKTVYVLQGQTIRRIPSRCCLGCTGIKCFVVQTIRRRTDVATADIAREDALVVGSQTRVRRLVPTVQRGHRILEASSVHVVQTGSVRLCITHFAGDRVGECSYWLIRVDEIAL